MIHVRMHGTVSRVDRGWSHVGPHLGLHVHSVVSLHVVSLLHAHPVLHVGLLHHTHVTHLPVGHPHRGVVPHHRRLVHSHHLAVSWLHSSHTHGSGLWVGHSHRSHSGVLHSHTVLLGGDHPLLLNHLDLGGACHGARQRVHR